MHVPWHARTQSAQNAPLQPARRRFTKRGQHQRVQRLGRAPQMRWEARVRHILALFFCRLRARDVAGLVFEVRCAAALRRGKPVAVQHVAQVCKARGGCRVKLVAVVRVHVLIEQHLALEDLRTPADLSVDVFMMAEDVFL